MKIPRTANAVGHIDDDLITAAAESKTKAKRSPWLKWGSIAACFALLVIAGTAILPSLFGGESAIIWPWKYQTVYEKYTELKYDGIEYLGRGREVSASHVGEIIGNHTVVGYDEINSG